MATGIQRFIKYPGWLGVVVTALVFAWTAPGLAGQGGPQGRSRIMMMRDAGHMADMRLIHELLSNGDRVRRTVTVRSDGVGISAEFLPYVFDPFRQDSRTQSSRGLGLGLSMTRHFVERHGGTIRASSEGVGKGTTFTVMLPLQPEQAARDEPRPADRGTSSLQAISALLVAVIPSPAPRDSSSPRRARS